MTEVTAWEQTKACLRLTPVEKRVSRKELQNFEIVERTPRQQGSSSMRKRTRTASAATPAGGTGSETTVEVHAATAGKSPKAADANPANAPKTENATETETPETEKELKEVKAATADAKRAEPTVVDTETVATALRNVNGKLEHHETVEETHLAL